MKENIENSIAKALAGESSAEELKALEAWRTDNADNEQAYQEFVKAWEASQEATVFVPDTDSAWERMQARLEQDTPVVSIAPETAPAATGGSRSWLKVAAVAAVLIVGALVATVILTGSPAMTEVAATSEMQEVQLPDGSTVWLNMNSTLEYPETFADNQRLVKLSGEAFFEVEKNPAKPFVIQTAHTETKVLGTSFNLRAYDNEETTSVVVTTGKVSFVNMVADAEPVILTPGERGAYVPNEDKLLKEQNQEPNYQAWKTREFKFDSVPFGEAEKVL